VQSGAGTVLHVSDKAVSLIDFYGFDIVVLFYGAGRKCKVITERRTIFCHSSYQ
jgi:hypothetical protein